MMPKQYSIVGQQFTGVSEAFMMNLQSGTEVLLVREPTNEFDPMAIAVYVDRQKIGYIPKKQNKVLAQFIDQSGRTELLAMDEAEHRTLPAKFVRSPNSGFPMVEVA
jgi:hypothetical protein